MLARALLAFLALPGAFAFAVPWILAALDPSRTRGTLVGTFVLGIGLAVLLCCVRDFYVAGKGTLAPWDPPRNLVLVGLYRFLRNPMYLGVLTVVGGAGLLAGSPWIAFYFVILCVVFHLRVLLHEEPWLSKQFPSDWERYRAAVPRWLPRTSPWRG